jgi:glutamate racemase
LNLIIRIGAIAMIKKDKSEQAIGLMDSGLGGLSVFKEIKEQLPRENIIYIGDTVHAPYGEKTDVQIRDYVISIIDFLFQKDAKIIIIACNTATAIALEGVEKEFPVPIIGVIQPGAYEATVRTKNNRVGIIGTEVTIRSKGYEEIITRINPSIATFSNSCSNQLIREMEEKALRNEDTIKDLLEECLKPIINNNIDTLVLGCTHYPFLKKYIEQVINTEICLVDPARATVKQAKNLLEKQQLINFHKNEYNSFFISGDPILFAEIATKLLGYNPGNFDKIIL